MNLIEKLRSGHVRRWHIVAVSREQTIADHMHRVGVIAEEILLTIGQFNWANNLTLNTMRWAAIHDRHEYLLGDLPTPGKRAILGEQGEGYDAVYWAAAKIDEEFLELSQCVGPAGECPLAGYIVKLADSIEAMNYIGIFGVGSHAAEVWRGLRVASLEALETLTGSLNGTMYELSPGATQTLINMIRNLQEGHHFS